MAMSTDEITALYREVLSKGPFPYADCRFLLAQVNTDDEDLIPELDLYFSSIAGLASGVHWRRWPLDKVEKWLSYINRDPVLSCPSLERYAPLITAETTPKLHRRLEVTDSVRRGLIPHLEAVLVQQTE